MKTMFPSMAGREFWLQNYIWFDGHNPEDSHLWIKTKIHTDRTSMKDIGEQFPQDVEIIEASVISNHGNYRVAQASPLIRSGEGQYLVAESGGRVHTNDLNNENIVVTVEVMARNTETGEQVRLLQQNVPINKVY